jgi:alginate O-acetyltransferase complex protein AlgI
MSFASHIFVFYFLPLVLLGYCLIPRSVAIASAFARGSKPLRRSPLARRRQNPRFLRTAFLLIASYVFYGWLNPWFVALVFGTSGVNYILSIRMSQCEGKYVRRILITIAVTINLALLAFFKYVVFFQENLNHVPRVGALIGLRFSGSDAMPVLHVMLPVGISFYTFRVLSYVIDVYRGNPPARSFLDFACYVAFFPQLLSGPIQRYGTIDAKSETTPTFADQLAAPTRSLSKFSYGAALFILGFSKKVLLADTMGQAADAVFAAEAPGTLDVWFGAAAYTFQLYFDFSAYSEMAIGLGSMLGFACPRNFNAPYRANSITDFWRRWHISLSSWFRDYLYIPLGGNQRGVTRSYFNLVAVFLLCGLWHGANWTFIIWGVYHGVFLVLERILGKRTVYFFLPRPLQIGATFALITVGWVLFRSPDMTYAWRLLEIMFTPSEPQGGSILLGAVICTPELMLTIAICSLLAFQPVQAYDWARSVTWFKAVILVGLFCLSLMVMFTHTFSSFLYFQF